MTHAKTSDEIAHKAGRVLAMADPFEDNEAFADMLDAIALDPAGAGARDAIHAHFDDWIKDARSLAASCLAQVENGPEFAAGTNAYDMLAAAEVAQVEVTETLIQMIAGVVLMGSFPDAKQVAVSFSPLDLETLQADYEWEGKLNGVETTVTIRKRETPIRLQSLKSAADDFVPFEPQAPVHVYDRPLWAARVDGKLNPLSTRDLAEGIVLAAQSLNPETVAQVENRFCYHEDCPAERCNHVPKQDEPEVTSEDS